MLDENSLMNIFMFLSFSHSYSFFAFTSHFERKTLSINIFQTPSLWWLLILSILKFYKFYSSIQTSTAWWVSFWIFEQSSRSKWLRDCLEIMKFSAEQNGQTRSFLHHIVISDRTAISRFFTASEKKGLKKIINSL